MTGPDRRLAAMIALFAPARAGALAARLGLPSAPDVRAAAEALARAPRRDRLAALGTALEPAPPPAAAPRSPLEPGGAAGRERPAVAALLDSLRAGHTSPGASRVAVRLCLEALVRT